MSEDSKAASSAYRHSQESVQRPDVGVEAQFPNKKKPKTYRYDSSLAPELCWDENAERPFAEWLLNLVAEAAERGEGVVFAQPQMWEGTQESFSSLSQCAARLRSLTKPFLNWAGKAERHQISVPTLPLFVHERHSTQAILETIKAHKVSGTTLDLFGDAELDIADKLDAYQHKGPWTNRLVLGDSLQVMNSLLGYEGLGGQVQMIYFDPPYGVKFGSNFQPFVRKSSVTHGKDDEMIREPEMVKAYRDTWELGLHSYLAYLRDRLLLARELLHESGSIFVQISDENLHHVRELLDEVFGADNFLALIPFREKTMPLGASYLEQMQDFLLWFGKSSGHTKFSQLYYEQDVQGDFHWKWYELPDGSRHNMSREQVENHALLPENARVFRLVSMWPPTFSPAGVFSVNFRGNSWKPAPGACYPSNLDGMKKLVDANRLEPEGKYLRYVLYLDDYRLAKITAAWADTVGARGKLYVVQTSEEVVKRCLLMTTDPGDLVMDITCGSGTTAVVSEQWGRRWITCDTSRIPLALARQRLLTATFPWYRLKNASQGPAGGFVYERKQNRKGQEVGGLVPRITLKSIANNEQPEMVTLVDRPEIDRQITRVCGPFTVEATIQAALTLAEEDSQVAEPSKGYTSPRAYLDRMIEVLRQSKTLQLPGNVSLELETVRPLADREYLHAEATAKNGSEKHIAIVFGPEDGAIGSECIFNAHTETLQQGFQQLFLFGFAIQAKARAMLDKLKLPTTYIAMTPDVVMSDLLKTSKSSEIFSITGLPDVTLEPAGNKPDGTPLHQVEVKGLDIFRPDTMETDCIEAENLPCWMLDTNYNGMVFCASQVFFPKTGAWDNLQKSLKADFSDSVWEHLAGTVSEPFILGDKQRVAIKVIDDRGNELMVVKNAEGAN
ncbi:site-specific DNA-methyltransferase [Methylolobus aquaticus]|nr:site-specific DNA-methyltransferase [Methylolobus aquaticus]